MIKVSKRESELLAKCQDMLTGLDKNVELFKNLPYPSKELGVQIDSCVRVRNDYVTATSNLRAILTNKKNYFELLNKIFEAMKAYCEDVADGDAAILGKVGLNPRKERKPLQIPGQPINLRITREGDDSAIVEWDNPPKGSGGAISVFQFERQMEGEDSFKILFVTKVRKVQLKDQVVGKNINFRIIAMNSAGTSLPSNTVSIKF